MSDSTPERSVPPSALAASETDANDDIRWFEETLHAWVASGEAIGDPWRLQELVLDAQERASAPGEAASLLVETLANETRPHLGETLRSRIHAALTAFVETMEGRRLPAPIEPRREAPALASWKHAQAELERTRDAIERGRRRLRLAREAASAQRSACQDLAQQRSRLAAENGALREALGRNEAALAGAHESLERVRHWMERDSGAQVVQLRECLDDIACDVHLARVATSAEVARRGADSEVGRTADLLRRLDEQIRRACTRHTASPASDTTDTEGVDDTNDERTQVRSLVESALAAVGAPTATTTPLVTTTPEEPPDELESLLRGAARIEALIEEGLSCCDQAAGRKAKLVAPPKSRGIGPPPASPV